MQKTFCDMCGVDTPLFCYRVEINEPRGIDDEMEYEATDYDLCMICSDEIKRILEGEEG